MTPNLLPIYIFSLASISLLALFARSNKRTGWVKPRATFVEDLRELQRAWEEEDQLSRTGASVPQAVPSTIENGAFTNQLTHLHGALARTSANVMIESAVEVRETAAK